MGGLWEVASPRKQEVEVEEVVLLASMEEEQLLEEALQSTEAEGPAKEVELEVQHQGAFLHCHLVVWSMVEVTM